MAYQGVDVRATGDRILFRAAFFDSAGTQVTTGTTTLRIFRYRTDGALDSYDFNDNTFKTTALTTPSVTMTHRQGDNSTFDTGVFTHMLTTVSGFTAGNVCFAWASNGGGIPTTQKRDFQYGNGEGDMVITNSRVDSDAVAVSASTTAADRLEAALTTVNGIDLNMGQTTPASPTANTTGEALRFAHEDLPNQVAAGASGGLPLLNANLVVQSDLARIQTSTTTATNLTTALATTDGITISPTQTVSGITGGPTSVGEAIRRCYTSLPNEIAPGAAGGLPTVDASNRIAGIQGTTYHTLDEVVAALTSGNSTLLVNTTSTASSTATQIFLSAVPGTDANDDYNGMMLIIYDASNSSRPSVHLITDYTATNNVCDITPNCRFTPANGDTIQVWAVTDSTLSSELIKLTTGFSAASPDNLNSYLKALMSKAASTPASVGTFNPATDSVEALRELMDSMAGAGFSTSTDSLQAIRDAIDTLVAPSIVSGSTSLSGSGFISDCIGLVRRAVDEPSTAPKYTNADILEFVQGAFDVILADININTDHPILVRQNISIEDGKQTYTLPPSVAQLWRVAKINTNSGMVEWEIWPGSEFSFHGRGFTLEGNTLRLVSDWNTADTLQLLYLPNSEVYFHKAEVDNDVTDITDTTLKFPTTMLDGTLDTRKNAYGGYMIRILESDQERVEERIITAWDNVTRIATIDEAWDTTPTGDVVYEVVPQYSRLLKHVVCLRAAMDLLAQEGNAKRMSTLSQPLQVKTAALRRYLSSKNSRFPHKMDGDTSDNLNRGYYGGEIGW